MGISSNQARLMTLTARQHDLELRAQQISAQKMITSLESQELAMNYSKKLNEFRIIKSFGDGTSVGNETAPLLLERTAIWANSTTKYLINPNNGVVTVDPSGRTYPNRAALMSAVANVLRTLDENNFLEEVKAEYDAATASLSSQEKLLDMELTQLNTEHNAVKTEYDSVKGLVSENTDKSFNVFG